MSGPIRRKFGVWRIEAGAEFILPEPPSANRWWRKWRGRMVLSTEAREYKEAIAQMGARHVVEGDVSVQIRWHRARKSGDLDKRLGVILDALQGVAYHNDSQIIELGAWRYDDPEWPRIVVRVTAA